MGGDGNGLDQKKSDQFEAQLKEILDSGPERILHKEVERPISPVFFHSRVDKKVTSSVEIVIRIVAALLVIGLLIRFGIQIAIR